MTGDLGSIFKLAFSISTPHISFCMIWCSSFFDRCLFLLPLVDRTIKMLSHWGTVCIPVWFYYYYDENVRASLISWSQIQIICGSIVLHYYNTNLYRPCLERRGPDALNDSQMLEQVSSNAISKDTAKPKTKAFYPT